MAYWMRAEPMGAEQRDEFDELLARTPEEWADLAEEEAAAVRTRKEQWLEEMQHLGHVG